MFHSGHMHLLVHAIENDDCPVDAMSLEVVCFYLDTVGDDDYTLTKTWTPCLWRNWLVSQVIGSFSSPDWCVSWNAPRAAVSEALAIDIRGAERYLLQAQCLFQQDAHRILQDDLLSVVVLPSKSISSHVQFFHVNKQWWAHLLIVGIVTFPAIFYLWRFQVCKFTSWCSFACLVGTSKQQNFAYRGSPLRQDIYIYIYQVGKPWMLNF